MSENSGSYCNDDSYYAYKITVNDKETHHEKCPSEIWSRIAEASESRGGVLARLERRLICHDDCTALFPCMEATDATGRPIWVSNWSTLAELDSHADDERSVIIIGATAGGL